MSTTIGGIRIIDMPDLGTVDDNSSLVGERAGSGRFAATALFDYISNGLAPVLAQKLAIVPTIAALRALASGAAAVYVQGYYAPSDGGGGVYSHSATAGTDNGGTVIVSANGTYRLDRRGGPLSVKQFGAKGDGTTDDSGAINAALAALAAPGGVIYFPSGKYSFASVITFTYPAGVPFDLTFIGDGMGATQLLWPASNGIALLTNIPEQAFHFRDLALMTSGSGASTAVSVTQSSPQGFFDQSDFVRVKFSGSDVLAHSLYWNVCVVAIGEGNINFDGCLFYGQAGGNLGTGVSLVGNMSATPPLQYDIVYNFINPSFWNLSVCILYGNHVQGVHGSPTEISLTAAPGYPFLARRQPALSLPSSIRSSLATRTPSLSPARCPI